MNSGIKECVQDCSTKNISTHTLVVKLKFPQWSDKVTLHRTSYTKQLLRSKKFLSLVTCFFVCTLRGIPVPISVGMLRNLFEKSLQNHFNSLSVRQLVAMFCLSCDKFTVNLHLKLLCYGNFILITTALETLV